jgi:hypothetical protein
MQNRTPPGCGPRAVQQHQAQATARVKNFGFWIGDFGLSESPES